MATDTEEDYDIPYDEDGQIAYLNYLERPLYGPDEREQELYGIYF
jgi:hypothetical protein